MEHGCRMICAGLPSFVDLELEDGHVPTFWLLLCRAIKGLTTLAPSEQYSLIKGYALDDPNRV